jgi:hypothetical protein
MERRGAGGTPLPVQWKFLTPLIWAPAFPVIRISVGRMRKSLQPVAVGFAIVLANLHGFWLISNPDLSNDALEGYEIGPTRRRERRL